MRVSPSAWYLSRVSGDVPYGRACKCVHRGIPVVLRCKVEITVKEINGVTFATNRNRKNLKKTVNFLRHR